MPDAYSDPTGTGQKHRWACPAGHRSWERVNCHIWCHACSQETKSNPDADPEWDELLDTKTGELVAYEDVKVEWPAFSKAPAY